MPLLKDLSLDLQERQLDNLIQISKGLSPTTDLATLKVNLSSIPDLMSLAGLGTAIIWFPVSGLSGAAIPVLPTDRKHTGDH